MPFFLKESDWTYFTWYLSKVYPKYLALNNWNSKQTSDIVPRSNIWEGSMEAHQISPRLVTSSDARGLRSSHGHTSMWSCPSLMQPSLAESLASCCPFLCVGWSCWNQPTAKPDGLGERGLSVLYWLISLSDTEEDPRRRWANWNLLPLPLGRHKCLYTSLPVLAFPFVAGQLKWPWLRFWLLRSQACLYFEASKLARLLGRS